MSGLFWSESSASEEEIIDSELPSSIHENKKISDTILERKWTLNKHKEIRLYEQRYFLDENNSFVVQTRYPEDRIVFTICSEKLSSPKTILFSIKLKKTNSETINRCRGRTYHFDEIGQVYHEKFLKLPTIQEYSVRGVINFKITITECHQNNIQTKRTFSPRINPIPAKYSITTITEKRPEISSITGAVQSKIFHKINKTPILDSHASPNSLKRTCIGFSTFSKPTIFDDKEKKDDSPQILTSKKELPACECPQKEITILMPLGLVNKGATCYMNSFLQALFHLHAFRSLVYAADVGGEKGEMVLAMQRLFASLERGSQPGDTGELMRSFGWEADDAYMQNDIQEFANVLIDALEDRLKNTPLHHTLDALFHGETETTITCRDAPITTRRREGFNIVSLTVEGIRSLRRSLETYTRAEQLTGDNKYNGEHDAEMRTKFAKLPRVLQLHLQRFSFEETGVRKINTYLSYKTELDMAPYMADGAEGETRYRLFGVFVHSGCSSDGHYYSYLHLSEGPGDWLMFNDSLVDVVMEGDAVQKNFGGYLFSPVIKNSLRKPDSLSERKFSAYMLMYIRVDALGDAYGPLTCQVPEHVLALPDREKEQVASEEKERSFRVCCYHTIAEAAQRGHVGLSFEEYPPISMLPSKTVSDLLEETKRRFPDDDCSDLRLWGCGAAGPSARPYPMEKHLDSITSNVIANTTMDNFFVLVYLYLPAYRHPVKFFSFLECDSMAVDVAIVMRNIRDGLSVGDDMEVRGYARLTGGSVISLKPGDRLSAKGVAHGDALVFEFSNTTLTFDELCQEDQPSSVGVVSVLEEPRFHPETYAELEEAFRTEVELNILRPDSDRRCDRFAVPRRMQVSDFLSFVAERQGIPGEHGLLLFGKGARFPVSAQHRMKVGELDILFPGRKTFFVLPGEEEELSPNSTQIVAHTEESESELSCEDESEKGALDGSGRCVFSVYFSPRPFVTQFIGRIFLPSCKAGRLFEEAENTGHGGGEQAVAIDSGTIASFFNKDDDLDWRYGVYRIDAYRAPDGPMIQVIADGALVGRGHANATPGSVGECEDQPFLFPVIEGEQARDFKRRLFSTIANENPDALRHQPNAIFSIHFKDTFNESLEIHSTDVIYPNHNVNTILVYITKNTQPRSRGIVIK